MDDGSGTPLLNRFYRENPERYARDVAAAEAKARDALRQADADAALPGGREPAELADSLADIPEPLRSALLAHADAMAEPCPTCNAGRGRWCAHRVVR